MISISKFSPVFQIAVVLELHCGAVWVTLLLNFVWRVFLHCVVLFGDHQEIDAGVIFAMYFYVCEFPCSASYCSGFVCRGLCVVSPRFGSSGNRCWSD